jgi:hypothetical protein
MVAVRDHQNHTEAFLHRHKEPVVSLAFNELKYRDQYKGDFLFSIDTQKLLVWAWKVSTCL